jgi:hypothetical protein
MRPQQTHRIAAFVLVAGFGLAASARSTPESCRVPGPPTSYSMEILVDGAAVREFVPSGSWKSRRESVSR